LEIPPTAVIEAYGGLQFSPVSFVGTSRRSFFSIIDKQLEGVP